MENIYKIRIRSDMSPQDLYPSERRYSSSIVLGLSVMFLALGATSTLMGTLVVGRITTNLTQDETFVFDNQNESAITNTTDDDRFVLKIEKELIYQQQFYHGPQTHALHMPALVTAATFLMSFGLFLAGTTGLIAWKQWYVDKNITWFFLSTCFASITAAISLLVITLTLIEIRIEVIKPQISLGLTTNVFITSLLATVWSVIASNIAFKGMKNSYPDDLVLSHYKGRVQVSTVKKGNKKAKVVPPDILSNFPTSGKLAKFLPKKERDGNLPKAESNKEFEERVSKFLEEQTGEAHNDHAKY